MEVTYIHHSCSLVETRLCYYLFDYEKGSLPRLNAEKPVIVFASHSHHDHYNPKVFTILKEMGMQKIQPVLSEDITPSGDPEQFCNTASAFAAPLRVAPNKEYILCLGQKLTTYRSTDLGVAFLIEDGEELFYHAGDLNDWVWEGEEPSYNEQMTRDYRRQIDALARAKEAGESPARLGMDMAAELIARIKEENLCAGVHIMAIGAEKNVPVILEKAGL